MSFEIVESDTPGRLRLVGELDLGSAETAEASIERRSREVLRLELDLSELSFIDSSGVRILLRAFKDLTDRGGMLVLDHPTEAVQRVFDLLGLAANGIVINTSSKAGDGGGSEGDR
jgi:anti-anti-sigma factor